MRASSASLTALLLMAPVVQSAEPAAPQDYGLSAQHRVLSQATAPEGRDALEVELTLANAGERGLFDLRLALLSVSPVCWVPEQEPARHNLLESGTQATVSWTFEVGAGCLVEPSAPMTFIVEAVDTTTQAIMSFTVSSTGG